MPIPRAITQSEKRLRNRLERQLATLADDVASLVEAQQKSLGDDIRRVIDNQFNAIVDSIVKITKTTIGYSQRKTIKDLEISVDYQELDKKAIQYLNSLQDLHLSERKGSIKRSTKRKVIQVITRGLEDGLSYTQIGERIRTQVSEGIFSKKRAEFIAVREVGKAYEAGRWQTLQEGLRQGYIYEKIRDTVNDERVTDQCRANENQGWILWNESFNSGDMSAPRNSHPRCRCTTNYRIADQSPF